MAGLFQFSRLRDFCLERCRTPMGFVLRHWRGPNPHRAALAIGLDHGLYYVGCCWALMLLMFLTGTASIGWMLLLGLVMAAENRRLKVRAASPLNATILATGAGCRTATVTH